MAEGLARKKKVRAAHRASVTRMVGQARELLSAETGSEPARLKQKRDALVAKAELLIKLDADILEDIHEDELEGEIDGADAVRERIELTIIELDSALAASDAEARIERRRGDSPRTRDMEVRRQPLPEVSPVPEDHSVREPSRTPSHREEDVRESTPTSEEESVVTHDNALSTTPATPHVKLPKLSLKRFNGDLTKWITFWDTFESAVHNNPALSDIDKFNYLTTLLESAAAEAIAGLTLTAANYSEAVATLGRRFGNKQAIINRHMDILLRLEPVTSVYNLKGLRHLFDTIESNVRGLRALGVAASSYGGLLSPILISRLPAELRLIISRELKEEEWNLEMVREIFQREIEARERSAMVTTSQTRKPPLSRQPAPTALSLTTGSQTQVMCAYCNQSHPSTTCLTVKDPEERKRVLRSSGRCFICLRRNHISRNCRSSSRCTECNGRHHTSLHSSSPPTNTGSAVSDQSTTSARNTPTTSSNMCVNSCATILLQTAKTTVSDASQLNPAPTIEIRAILDTGSQRSYVTTRVKEGIRARTSYSETMVIKTFGSERGERRVCEVIELKVGTRDGGTLTISTVVVPHICDPVRTSPISSSSVAYEHISGLELADPGVDGGDVQIDLLIGCDHYWEIVTGRVVRGTNGPTAIETRLGWVLSGPAEDPREDTTISFVTTHLLRFNSDTEIVDLDAGLKRFWDLESLGILKDEHYVQQQFSQEITLRQGRYEVHLPWKKSHPTLPDNFDLCKRRLGGLLKRLSQTPENLRQYDLIIQEQLEQGVVEVVREPENYKTGRLHYLPHHGVFRNDKQTTKLRVVYDASAKSDGPSLNDCLHTGPNFGQNILEILLRFRLHHIALVGDVEKAFLMVSVAKCDRDVLRFLWIADVNKPHHEVVIMRFTRVVFGVSASPFLLNATIDHHMNQLELIDKEFVDKFRRSIYVDDVATGFADTDSAYGFYKTASSQGQLQLKEI